MTVYEYLTEQRKKLLQAYKNSGESWISEKIHEIQTKIDRLSIEEAERDYRAPRR